MTRKIQREYICSISNVTPVREVIWITYVTRIAGGVSILSCRPLTNISILLMFTV
ncbi:unnamed protein product [Brassica oleracea]